MSSEVDPLLPKNESAPEITGYGFSSKQRSKAHEVEEVDDNYRGFYVERERNEDNEGNDYEVDDRAPRDDAASTGGGSPITSLLGIFVFVVLFAFFISIGLGGGSSEQPQPEPVPKRPSPGQSIEARVARILDETPLIGLWSRSTILGH